MNTKVREIVEGFEQLINNVDGLDSEILRQLLEETALQMRGLLVEERQSERPRKSTYECAIQHLESELQQLRQDNAQLRGNVKQLNQQLEQKLRTVENELSTMNECSQNRQLNMKQHYLELATLKQVIEDCKTQLYTQSQQIIQHDQNVHDMNVKHQRIVETQKQELQLNHQEYLELENRYKEEVENLQTEIKLLENRHNKQIESLQLKLFEQNNEQSALISMQKICRGKDEEIRDLKEQMELLLNEFETKNDQFDELQQLVQQQKQQEQEQSLESKFKHQLEEYQSELRLLKQLMEEKAQHSNRNDMKVHEQDRMIVQLQQRIKEADKKEIELSRELNRDKQIYQNQAKLVESKHNDEINEYEDEIKSLKEIIQCKIDSLQHLQQQHLEQESVIQSQKQIIEDNIDQLQSHKQDKKTYQRELDKFKIINEGLQDQLSINNKNHLSAVETINKELRYQKQLVKQLEDESFKLHSVIKANECQKQDYKDLIEQLKRNNEEYEKDMSELQKQLNSVESELYQSEQQYKQLKLHNDQLNQQLQENKRRQQQQLDSNASQIKQLQQENNELSQQLNENNENLAQIEILEQQQQQCIEFQTDKINRYEQQIRSLKQQLQSYKTTHAIKDTYRTPEKELINSYESRLQTKQKEIQQLQDMYQQVIEENETLVSQRTEPPRREAQRRLDNQDNMLESEVIEPEHEGAKLATIIKNIQRKTLKH